MFLVTSHVKDIIVKGHYIFLHMVNCEVTVSCASRRVVLLGFVSASKFLIHDSGRM